MPKHTLCLLEGRFPTFACAGAAPTAVALSHHVQYIQCVVNIQNEDAPDAERHRFFDEMGTFFAQYGLAHSLGLVYGYLLLAPGAETLDEIADGLGISKSGVSVTARQLQSFGMVRRVPERGSRRIRYEPIPALAGLFEAGVANLRVFLRTLEDGRRVAPPGLPADRMGELATGMSIYLNVVETTLARIKETRGR